MRFHKAVNWRSRLKTETTEHISPCRFQEDDHSAVDADIISQTSQRIGLGFPKIIFNVSFMLSRHQDCPRRRYRHHDGCHDTVFDGAMMIFREKWSDMAGDPSLSETRRVGSGRPQGGCFRGRRGYREGIAPDVETGPNGEVCLCDLQSFYWSLE